MLRKSHGDLKKEERKRKARSSLLTLDFKEGMCRIE